MSRIAARARRAGSRISWTMLAGAFSASVPTMACPYAACARRAGSRISWTTMVGVCSVDIEGYVLAATTPKTKAAWWTASAVRASLTTAKTVSARSMECWMTRRDHGMASDSVTMDMHGVQCMDCGDNLVLSGSLAKHGELWPDFHARKLKELAETDCDAVPALTFFHRMHGKTRHRIQFVTFKAMRGQSAFNE
jgi:hypothetical protein